MKTLNTLRWFWRANECNRSAQRIVATRGKRAADYMFRNAWACMMEATK